MIIINNNPFYYNFMNEDGIYLLDHWILVTLKPYIDIAFLINGIGSNKIYGLMKKYNNHYI